MPDERRGGAVAARFPDARPAWAKFLASHPVVVSEGLGEGIRTARVRLDLTGGDEAIPQDLASALDSDPTSALAAGEAAVRALHRLTTSDSVWFEVRLQGKPWSVAAPRGAGCLASVDGALVLRASSVVCRAVVAAFRCGRCGSTTLCPQPMDALDLVEPASCEVGQGGCGAGGARAAFEVDTEACRLADVQRLELLVSGEKVKVVAAGPAAGVARVGDRVRMSAVRVAPSGGSLVPIGAGVGVTLQPWTRAARLVALAIEVVESADHARPAEVAARTPG